MDTLTFQDLIDAGCMKTYEQSLAELEELEAKIAKNLNITGYIEDLDYHGTIRESILYKLCVYEPNEDELIRDWNQQFSWYYHTCKEEFEGEYIKLRTLMELCHYTRDCSVFSFIKTQNEHYQKIINSGKFDVIPVLLNYIGFGWVVFCLLSDISNNNMVGFNDEYAGMYDKVKEYWLNWGKEKGYIK